VDHRLHLLLRDLRHPGGFGAHVRRLQAALQVAGLLRDEAGKSLAHLLEGSIVALIVLEIVLAFLR
jgi:hypothetical protein